MDDKIMKGQADLFQWVDSQSSDARLIDTVYLTEGTWFRWDRIQLSDWSVTTLKQKYGNRFSLTLMFFGKLLIKAGVSSEGKSFVWCGETNLSSPGITRGVCEIDLRNVTSGSLEITLYAIEESAIFGDVPPLAMESSIRTEQILYTFSFPSYDLCCEEPLYCHFIDTDAWYSFTEKCVHLKKKSSVDLTTYFNAFSASKWKEYTNVDALSLYIDFMGKARAEIVHLVDEGREVLASWRLDAPSRTTLELPLGKYPDTGLLGLRIHAKDDCVLYGGGWMSDAPEMQPVHLGIGITTFCRENAVKDSVARLGKAIAGNPLYRNSIDITVVDNGQTLKAEDLPDAKLIPNKNLGGAGGFTRSLIHYQEAGRYTHCLFMDDDASCEVTSIFRSISFIRHAKDSKTALCGAMLYDNVKFLQWENGAWFNHGCHSLKHDFDLRDPQKLLSNEKEVSKRLYGAWWFFLFPIAQVRCYAFPCFVRGDDIDFSYTNDFRILTLNGVSCWQENFKTKENARSVYFFLRTHILHHMTLEGLGDSFLDVWKVLKQHFSAYNNAWFYGCAASANLAVRHVLQGPEFWADNITPEKIFCQIKTLSACEKCLPCSETERAEMKVAEVSLKTHLFPGLLRKLSFWGHLIPSCMLVRSPKAMVFKWMTPDKKRTFLRDRLIVYDEVTQTKILLQRNVPLYFKNLIEFLFLCLKLFLLFKSLKKKYRVAFKEMKTSEFWKKFF